MPNRKAKDKKGSEKKGYKITRRTVLKMGAAAGAVTVLTSRKSFNVYAQGSVTEPVIYPDEPADSPPHHPFVDSLPIPLPAIPQNLNPAPQEVANTGAGEAARANHQRWAEFQPEVKYPLIARASTHRFHSDFLPSYVWAFNDSIPAPTILNAYNYPTVVRFRNNLPTTTSAHRGWS